ncbi:TadE/TadG family type IV pilus assembly protein [Stakelama saccharophila]|uniref:TadE/TadG family type IV pilus assembly protein n=1 Tax=Stakelama saccharophila TaxID=3075605 RepID=A0ABZ0BCT9_9SPHN|nr:TadE/TadG family type IV pilus assembly protein [Stakelama sp. W311]WNO55050.1 TadE/TadG family type IV pilus assembly protein [Stakelama sp. W311]
MSVTNAAARCAAWYLRKLASLASNRRASALPFMAAALLPVLAVIGAAVDTGRLYIVKSQLQAGVDAGALAGARAFGITDDSPTSRDQQALSYFYGNFPDSPPYMGVENLQVLPEFTRRGELNVTTLTATAEVPMTFMRIFGIDRRSVAAEAKAELQPRPLEVMVILDNTGSMRNGLNGGTRMTALKSAAHDFLDVLYQGRDKREDLAIGFLPYDITVNVGHLLEKASIPLKSNGIEPLDGFTYLSNPQYNKYWHEWPANKLAWKGCVMADPTIPKVNNDIEDSDPGAWDLTRSLPGENGRDPVRPFFMPPLWIPNINKNSVTQAQKLDPESRYYQALNYEGGDNRYLLTGGYTGSAGETVAKILANTDAYRDYFFEYYIDLNEDGPDSSYNDVIRKKNGNGYVKPTPGKSHSNDWAVDPSHLPQLSSWKQATDAVVNPKGGSTTSSYYNKTPIPSPNWQCPQEAMLVQYDRPKSDYDDYIDQENGAIYPANGTLHHSGLLWGFRLLVRDDAFPRDKPTNELPRRAIVFMTDGQNEISEEHNRYKDRTYTWYGRWTDGLVPGDQVNVEKQSELRFSKTCSNIHREANPPEVYIIALATDGGGLFDNCAPGHVYRTSSTDELRKAFQDVATELVDLHLVQ